jgi:DNA-binding NarL/FixJ family response regulator
MRDPRSRSRAPLSRCEKLQNSLRGNPSRKWPLSVIMVGGSQALRVTIRAMVRHEPGFFLVAETETGAAALALVFRWQPAVALVEVCLPDRNGFEVVKCINQLVPTCAAIILSNAPDPCVEDVARINGAKAVWHKGSGIGQLRRTLRRLVNEAFARPCPN